MDRQKIERISKALADRTRLRILEAISSRDHMNCAQIVSMRGVTPATVSHHLRILQDAGLIECHRQGQFVHSKALPQALKDYTRELSGLARKTKNKRNVAK
jgi:ArsR family transcriptional regulator, arsenate/arsenite/antimonite-responsive transcriptional repressor